MAAIDEITRTAPDEGAAAARDDRSVTAVADRAARAALRAQIAALDRRFAVLVASACPRLDHGPTQRAPGGPRLLDLDELERARDALAVRVADLEARRHGQQARQAHARRTLERMRADPPAHRWRRLSNADLGRPGCTTYHVRPKAGVLGWLLGWWEVKVSGGCPLPG
jgi:hypothetical protein